MENELPDEPLEDYNDNGQLEDKGII